MPTTTECPVAPRRGRNKPLAAQRRARAVELATAGHSYRQIAPMIGIANPGTVHRMVKQALTERTDTAVNELRATSYTRLEGIVSANWAAMKEGDVRAAQVILNAIGAEVSLFGLDKAVEAGQNAGDMPTTVVAPEWIARHA